MRELTIAGRRIADDTDAWCIAELGSNHGGSLEVCKQMIRAAAAAGADAVKLQKRDNKTLYTRAYYDQPYTSENSFGATYGEHREALEFTLLEYRELTRYCHKWPHPTLFATAFDSVSADDLADLEVPAFKIASGDLTNTPLIRHVAAYGRPVIISTGAGTMQDVDRAVEAARGLCDDVAILHCTAAYPAPAELLNLRVISTYRERYPDIVVGLSSHYSGISDVVAAYVLGARIFEKHFTLDRTAKGTDHAFSLEPAGFAKMVSYLRNTRAMLGSGEKTLQEVEQPALAKMGTLLYARCDLKPGDVIGVDDIAVKSPGGDGLHPYRLCELLGKEVRRAIHVDEPFEESDVQ